MKYLEDKNFLKELDLEERKRQYVRITVLDFKTELPIAAIEGKATGGTINLNGSSSVRRVMSCSLLVDPEGINDKRYKENISYGNITEIENTISMNKKVRAEIGFDNTLAWRGEGFYPEYDKIWIPLGIFVVKAANAAKSTGGINLSLTLNDKAALLNGDMGGTIPAATVLSESELYNADATERTVEKLLIKDVIKYLVVDFGGEDPSNVIIEDIPDTIVKVMKWTGNTSLYIINKSNNKEYRTTPPDDTQGESLEEEFEYGEDVGYMNELFVYPGTLECNAGDTVAAMLDKIKNTLGNHEWFYDIHGRFHFQEKKNYLNTSVTATILNLTAYDYLSSMNLSKSVYTFDDSNRKLLTNISSNPQYQNVKNDFIIWGTKKTSSGAEKPIRYHLVFDEKPVVDEDKKRLCVVYTDYRGLEQVVVLKEKENLIKNSVQKDTNKDKQYYYLSEVGDKWYVEHWDEENQCFRVFNDWEVCYLTTDDWRTELYFLGLESTNKAFAKNYYSAELNAEWTKIYNVRAGNIGDNDDGIPIYSGDYRDIPSYEYEYFLDFIDSRGGGNQGLSQFNVDNIGRRTVVGKDKTSNCIFTREVPNYIVIHADGDTNKDYNDAISKNQNVVQASTEVFDKLVLGGGTTSAFDKIKELLIQHTHYNESVSLTTIPIYYLEPNTRITIFDSDINISGDYMINTISLPLGIGTSTISCTKAISKENNYKK